MPKNEKDSLSVYFNSACPVCNAGISSQKNKSTACSIQWKDVHENNQLVNELNKNLTTVRKYLHVIDENNQQYIGIHAFILLWENSPKEQWKAYFFALPAIRQLSQLGYYTFANCLYIWNKLRKNW